METTDDYNRRIDAMTPTEKFEIWAKMLAEHRRKMADEIVAEKGEMSDLRLKWEIALRLYGDEPIGEIVREKLAEIRADEGKTMI